MNFEHTTPESLKNFTPRHDAFIGVDSDGCVFDTMGVKQRLFFHPAIVKHWHLEKISAQVMHLIEYLNLNSKNRGQNRFPNLLKLFTMLPEQSGVRESGVEMPKTAALKAYCESGLPLGNPSLKAEAERTNNPELISLLEWSVSLNQDIESKMPPVTPFTWAKLSLEMFHDFADVVVVSQTPDITLKHEWDYHEIDKYADIIAGQEAGTKAAHLKLASAGKYPPNRVVMIGDAPGDLKAAKEANVLFFPIRPNHENDSWHQFYDEAFPKFLGDSYAGTYQDKLLEEFDKALVP